MTDAVVVDKLSKKFLLQHNAKPKPGERMLRDTMAQAAKRMLFSSSADRQKSGEEEVFWALREVGFTVAEGERLGIVGRNGAGKSTLLKLISRITSPTSGSIRIRGRLSSLLEVGTGFHPELTGRENIYLNGAILGMRQAEVRKKFDAIVDFAEVERFLDTPVKRYSSGMYVRLAFSVAAHLEPDVLVLDEVLAVGDAQFQRKCFGKIRELGDDMGRTVLLVSHSMSAVSAICSRGILLDQGSVAADGPVSEIVQAYEARGRAKQAFGQVDLSEITDRTGGNDGVRIVWAELIPYGEFSSNSGVHVGGGIQVRFSVIFDAKYINRNIKLAIVLKAADGTPLANMIGEDSGFSATCTKSEETFSVYIDDIRLYPSLYCLGFWVGSESSQTWDFVDECVSFEILPEGGIAKRRLPREAGLLFLTPSWRRD